MQRESIWITGVDGRLGKELTKLLKKEHQYKIVATGLDVDVTDMKEVEKAALLYKPSLVINCASISDAEYCEQNRVEAFRVNTLGARNMAAIASRYNAKIIHFSTDDVFSGEHDRPKNEFDVPTPNTVYGQSKYAGENYVRELNPKHLVIRSSWLYGAGTDSYFEYVAAKGKAGESFTAAVDEISTPTSVDALGKAFMALIGSEEYGIIHAACEGMCSRHQYAQTVLSLLGYDPSLAQAVLACKEGAGRSTVLENLMLKMTGICEMPEWKEELTRFAKQYKEAQ